MLKKIKIYHAADLFNLPARQFNETLVNAFEANNLEVFSPQRDGFEFTQLQESLLKNKISNELIDQAVNTIIYTYDIFSLSKSDVAVARIDEPQDPGVDTEVLIANALGIPVINYRTDIRNPYGLPTDKYSGLHSFPIKTSKTFIIQKSSTSVEKDFQNLKKSILKEIDKVVVKNSKKNNYIIPKFIQPTLEIASILFAGIDNIHSESGFKELINRCLKNKEKLIQFGPTVIRS
jgi:nucleoside 2-deoxyribosyltransferase